MELSSEESKHLELLEEGLWRAEVRFNHERMDEILASDFFEIGRSGRFNRREDMFEGSSHPIDARLPLTDVSIRMLDANIAQVTYQSTVTYDGVEELAYRSSIWSRTGQRWQLRFHQGTAI